MKISYDSEEDILHTRFKDGPAESVKEVEDNVIVELNRRGGVMA